MPEHLIDSLDDPRLDVFRELKKTNLTRWSGRFIAEGVRVVKRLLASELEVESVLVSRSHRHRILGLCLPNVDVFTLPQSVAEMVVGYRFHAGVLACAQRPGQPELATWAQPDSRTSFLVACPNTTDPDNLGTIIRIAAAFGAEGILLGRGCADPFSRRTVRVSMGNVFQMPIREADDIEAELRELGETGKMALLGAVLSDSAIPLADCPVPSRAVLLLGNEADGLPQSLIDLCDQQVTIPMAVGVDSLNVGISAGILMYHFRQHANRFESQRDSKQ